MKMRVLHLFLLVAFMATLTPRIEGHARHGGRAVIKLKGRCIVPKAATTVLPRPKTKRDCLTACRAIEAAKGCQYREGNKMCKVVMESFEKANFKFGNGSYRLGVTCWRFTGGPARDEGIKGRCIVAKAATTVLPGPKTKKECLTACRAIEAAKGCQYRKGNKMCKVVIESFEKANFKRGMTCWRFSGGPVDGGWGTWGAWSSCNSSTGIKKRNRQCNNPTPVNGGVPCAGKSEESEKCLVDGGWGPWGAWASCNSSTGMRKRNRQCNNPAQLNGGAPCAGKSQDSEKCSVDGEWGPWGTWASCNSSTGMKKRNRQCNNPTPVNGGAPCAGKSEESEKCSVDGGWGPWGAWASCNSSTGMRKRNRHCNNPTPLNGGAPCAGKSEESEKCSVDGGWGPWGTWASCNSSTGMMKRNRQCNNPKPLNGGAPCAGKSQESDKCSVDGGWGPWGTWASCNSSTGMMKRNRQCNNPKPLNGGAPCAGENQESDKCSVDGGWGPWGTWASYNSSTGMMKRNRQCNNPKPLNGGAPCAGKSQESDECSVEGGWGPWGTWTSCNSSTGMWKRNRQCNNPTPLNGGAPCAGKSQESEKCSDNTLIFLGPDDDTSGQSDVFVPPISENNNLTSATCTVPQYPITDIKYSVGFIYQDFLHICGGKSNSRSPKRQSACFSLINSNWSETTPMLSARSSAAAVKLHNGSVLVSGGLDNSNSWLQTSELLTGSTWTPSIQLPNETYGHCMLQLSTGEIFLHGGSSNSGLVSETHISNDQASWEKVISSKNKWWYHTCTEVIINSEQQVWVGEGNSTEIFQLVAGTWIDGPDLPNYCNFVSGKFVSYNGKLFYACGGDKNIYQLKDNWGTQQDAWTKIGEMSEKRDSFPALLITEDVCKGVKATPPTTDTATTDTATTTTASTPLQNAASIPPV